MKTVLYLTFRMRHPLESSSNFGRGFTTNTLPCSCLMKIKSSPIIGQIWKGFYNRYMTLIMTYENNIPSHYMPYILIAKDKSQLLVLFEIDNESFKLKQSLSVN